MTARERGRTEHVRAQIDGTLGRIVLDRPAALNALDLAMFEAVEDTLLAWRDDVRVRAIVVRGAGRAFAAGGDIRAVREAVQRGDDAYLRALYGSEYGTDAIIAEYPKPYVALVDGYCMGGGLGLAVHGAVRAVGERAVVAMPETAIGFFPDVGCTYVFPRLPHRVGWYCGLTGYRMDAADALWCGIATHHVPGDRFDAVESALRDETARRGEPDAGALVARFATAPPESRLAAHAAQIERCFGAGSLRATIDALEAEGGDWAAETLAALRRVSPSALVATWALFARGATMTLRDALAMELRAALRMLHAPDFSEGVRSVVIDKDRSPAWRPPTLEEVDAAAIEAMVAECATGVPNASG